MYENVFGEITSDPTHGGGWDKPVLVLDLSPEARERRVEAGAKRLQHFAATVGLERRSWKDWMDESRAVLASTGDTPAGEGSGK